jgi:hypothetical protein
LSDIFDRIPEFTFNNMHGTVGHIGSTDAKIFRSKPNMSAVDKVRMNFSGAWTTKEVWESGVSLRKPFSLRHRCCRHIG